MKYLEIPEFKTQDELFKFLKDNQNLLMAQKKAELKYADAISYAPIVVRKKEDAEKANEPVDLDTLDQLKVLVVINTTNLMDNHSDVHIPALWDKSLRENKMIMHLQEHKMNFASIISEGSELKAYTKFYSWSELGYDYEGQTEALVFESTIKRDRNTFMFEQYGKGFVKNHSVGMRYVKIVMCVNSDKEYYGAEKEAWDKYYPLIANKEKADSRGYFWAVKEAQVIEGSAVPLGSNWATPTLDNNKDEDGVESSKQVIEETEEVVEEKGLNYEAIIENLE